MGSLLDKLNLPEDLPKLDIETLDELAEEIRQRLVDVVSKNGGHLASNLGIVELTLGMYTVWNPYKDRIVWDVGHQCYVHKILTGRNKELATLRQLDGISGFPKREENPADAFNTGHSSTSISAALGIMRGLGLQKGKSKCIAVIGDGALTGGMAFEALNDAARVFNDFVIILNDNGMSISRNVGGMSRYLGKIRTGRSYIRIKKGLKNTLYKIPFIGEKLVKLIQKFKLSIKILVIPGEIFEELGFKYIGPVDGHNINAIRDALQKADFMYGPVIVHVVTKKGYGYKIAEDNPDKFHGVGPFDKETGEVYSEKRISFSKSFSNHLCELAEKDERVIAITAAMQNGTGLSDFLAKYPDRFYDVGIAEQHAITMASGMATTGVKPFVAMYSTFLQRAYDQVLHDAALQSLPIVIAVDRAGISGMDGETHQGIYDIAYLTHIPNITIAAPCCIEEQIQLMDMALEYDKGPFVIRYPAYDEYEYDRKFLADNPCIIGQGLLMEEEKDNYDIVFIAIGKMVGTALKASHFLKEKGYNVNVFNARFANPLDVSGIKDLVSKAKCYMTLEDGVKVSGFGSSVVCQMAEEGIQKPCRIIGFPSSPIPHGSIDALFKRYGMDVQSIADAAIDMIEKL
mgnify:CR=1 FL=1